MVSALARPNSGPNTVALGVVAGVVAVVVSVIGVIGYRSGPSELCRIWLEAALTAIVDWSSIAREP